MQDAYSPLTIDQARRQGAGGPAADRPGPGFIESIRLGFARANAQPDWGANQRNWEERALAEIRAGLRQRGFSLEEVDPPYDPRWAPMVRDREIARLLGLAQRQRERDPDFLPDYAGITDRGGLEALIARRRAAEVQRIDSEAQGGSAIGDFIGQTGRGLTDPLSYIPIPGGPASTGIARQIIGTGIREAGANMAVTAAIEPLVQMDAARIGTERGAGDFLMDLGTSGAAGFVIGGAFEAAPHGARAAYEAIVPLDRRAAAALADAAIVPSPPGQAGHLDFEALRAFQQSVPAQARTLDQQAAMHVVRRDAELASTSPFVPGPAGDDAHRGWLDLAMRRLTEPDAVPAVGPAPVPRSRIVAGAAGVGQSRFPAREELKARINRAETSARDDYNEGSGAMGPYQFLASTWFNYFRRRYPNDPRLAAEAAALRRNPRRGGPIAALRRDPALNDLLMNDLLADNGRALARIGAEENAGNLYLLHWAGEAAGTAFLRADPNARAMDVYRRVAGARRADAAFRHNPTMRGTVGEAIAWAHRQMGGAAPRGRMAAAAVDAPNAGADDATARPAVALHEADPEVHDVAALLGLSGDDAPRLRPEMFASAEEHARAQLGFDAARDGAEGFTAVIDDRLFQFDPATLFPALREHIDRRGSLRPEAIAEALGVTPAEAREVAQAMARSAGPNNAPAPILIDRNGRIMTRPTPPPRGPRSLAEFIADRGGMEDLGGELAAMGADSWHRDARFRGRLVRERSPAARAGEPESIEHGADRMLEAAIEAGYFPEERAHLGAGGEARLSTADLFEALDEEMRGRPRYSIDQEGERAVPTAEEIEADREWAEREIEAIAASWGIEAEPQSIAETLSAMEQGRTMEEALSEALIEQAAREIDAAAALTGDPDYAIDPFEDPFDAAIRARETEDSSGGAAGAGRSEAAGGAEGADRAIDAQRVGDPEADGFDEPLGEAARRQSDSLEHDQRMAVADAGEDAPQGAYRLDEEGDEAEIAAIWAEIEAERRAAAEMRACMAPGGGEA